jgi:hypothetical protein
MTVSIPKRIRLNAYLLISEYLLVKGENHRWNDLHPLCVIPFCLTGLLIPQQILSRHFWKQV